MCGIAGMCSFTKDYTCTNDIAYRNKDVLKTMRKIISHRGNDQTGEYLHKHVGLSHTRLSIRDVENGIQPMIREKAGKQFGIVYNGEIYNTQELTKKLKGKCYEFGTTSDTEVILNLYIEYGTECIKMLNGIFAFAIWDGAKERLVLARDRVGVKPFFYSITNGELVFGSEIKAVMSHPNVNAKIDTDSFREIFGIGPARTPGIGVFNGIKEVEPGTFAIFNDSGITYDKYWDIVSCEHRENYEDTVSKVSYLVNDAITRQMVSDVPVCCFLSGGIDSSIVTSVADKVIRKSEKKLNTYSFDFTENDKYFQANSFQPSSDRPFVDIMLSNINSHHEYLFCDEVTLADLLGEAMMANDLPGMADVDASMLYFCKLVSEKNKVVLTGECADEIFGGYPWFYRKDLMQGTGFPWSKNIDTRTCLLKDEFSRKLNLEEYVKSRYDESIKGMSRLEGESKEESRRREIAYLNIKWFMQTLLNRMDRMSMFSGLEARVPFADHRIIEYVYNVPWDMKCKNGIEKSLLREAFKDVLPSEVLYRKKSPYPKTYNPQYENILKSRLIEIVEDKRNVVNDFISKEKVYSFINTKTQYGKPWFGQLMAGPQMMAYIIQISKWLEINRDCLNI